MDVGYKGHPWTWCNNWDGDGEIKQRLDRGLSSYPWMQTFERATCKHLDSFASDHSMLLFDTKPGPNRRKKRFYFDKRWLQREEINDVVKQGWDQEVEGTRMFKLTTKVKRCRIALLTWKNRIQGNSKVNIERAKKQLLELGASGVEDIKNKRKCLKNKLKEA
ncbi:uncharacterized protein [Coffea arabica]|uniref:Uncharacterized protein n=1 Tax=Coffea arabica TaxID=13443 RepID=A0A6P6VLX4_COFAR|nr:uncharacterized protein LOC113724234 [Coffea arabica]